MDNQNVVGSEAWHINAAVSQNVSSGRADTFIDRVTMANQEG